MVLPLFKVLSLVLRVFSKPLITHIKKVHLKNDAGASHPILRKGFIYAGNSYNRFETYINRRFMKIQTQFAYKPLNDELAIEKGIEFLYEVVFYAIVIGLPLYEMMQASDQAKAKSIALEQKLKNIDDRLNQIAERQAKRAKLKQLKKIQEQERQKHILLREQQQAKILKAAESVIVNPAIHRLVPTHTIKLNFLNETSSHYHIFFHERVQPTPQPNINIEPESIKDQIQQNPGLTKDSENQ